MVETDSDEMFVVNAHLSELPVKLSVYVKAKTKFTRCFGNLSFKKDRIKLDCKF